MAEFVQKRLEELLPELEQLERVQLFTKDEIRAVIRKRREFEYRLQRKRKATSDYTRYIDYEQNLLQLVWKRRDRLGYQHKKGEIDNKIVSRIHQLYRVACIRFSDEVSLFLAHVEFCRRLRQLSAGSRVYTRLLRVHAHRPHLWQAAAQYELEVCNSADSARQLLLRGLRLHPESQLLWTAHFRLELTYADQLRQRQHVLGVDEVGKKRRRKTILPQKTGEMEEEEEDNEGEDDAVVGDGASDAGEEVEGDPVLRGAVARAVALQALRQMPEADPAADPCRLLTAMLAACREFPAVAGDLQSELSDALHDQFPQRALTYDTLARAELRGGGGGQAAPTKLRHRLQLCCEMYEQGVSQAPADEVYSLYVSSLVEAARAAPRHRHLILPRLADVLGRAQQQRAATEHTYLEAARLYRELGLTDEAVRLLEAATDACPTSAELWLCRLQAVVAAGDAAAACAVFEAASVAVPDSAAGADRLWLTALEWAAGGGGPAHYAQHVFSAAAARGGAVLRPLKATYLRWLAAARDLQSARDMFDEHHVRPPLDAELFVAMAELEARQRPVDVARLRHVHRAACRHVGDTRADVWLQHVRFERELGEPGQVAAVYRQAVKALSPAEADSFVAQHALMVANVAKDD